MSTFLKMAKISIIFLSIFMVFAFAIPHTSNAYDVQNPASKESAQPGQNTPVSRISAFSFITSPVETLLAWLAFAVLTVFGLFVTLTGSMLDASIQYFVVGMADWVNGNAAVNLGWLVMRDIANAVFLFILIYIGINTILRASSYQWKKMLFYVIIAAILVNFSMLLAKVVIDVSNVAAYEIYKTMSLDPECYDAIVDNDAAPCISNGVGAVFMNQLGITSFLQGMQKDGIPVKDQNGQGLDSWHIFLVSMIAVPFFLLVAFVFGAGAILITMRLITLIIVIILSPIAFAAFVLPGMQAHWKKWLNTLLKNAFFAPIYLLMLWLAIKTVEGMNASAALGGAAKGTSPQATTFFLAMVSKPSTTIGIILTFALISIFLIYALIVPKQLGAIGASTVVGYGNSWRRKAWVYTKAGARNTGSTTYDFTAGAAGRKVAGAVGRWEQNDTKERPFYNPLNWKITRRTAASVGKTAKERAERLQKKDDKFTTKELGRQVGTGTFASPSQKASVLNTAAKRGQVHELDPALVASGLESMRRLNMDTAQVLRQAPHLLENKVDAKGKTADEQLKEIMSKQSAENIRQMNAAQITKEDKERTEGKVQKDQLINAMVSGYSGSQLGVLMSEGNNISTEVVKKLENIGRQLKANGNEYGNTFEAIADHIEKSADKMTDAEKAIGVYTNTALASQLRNGTFRRFLGNIQSKKDLDDEKAKNNAQNNTQTQQKDYTQNYLNQGMSQ